MKTLWLIRHAKSSWKHAGLPDALRPLSGRGYRQGAALARAFPSQGVQWVCSPTVRAYTTCRLLTPALPQLAPELYPGDPEAVMAWLGQQGAHWPSLALVGHNPGMEDLVRWLSGRDVCMKTATAVGMELQIEHWRQVAPEKVEACYWLLRDL